VPTFAYGEPFDDLTAVPRETRFGLFPVSI